MESRVVGTCKKIRLQLLGGLEADPGDRDGCGFQLEKPRFKPSHSLFQGEGRISPGPPEILDRTALENEGRMDPDKVGLELDHPIPGLQDMIERVARKADHQMIPFLEP